MRFGLVGGSAEFLKRPERRREDLELVFGFLLRDAVATDQAVFVAHDGVLRGYYGELREAVDAEDLEESLGIGHLEGEWSGARQTCVDIAARLPGHALGLPASELPRPNRWNASGFDHAIQREEAGNSRSISIADIHLRLGHATSKLLKLTDSSENKERLTPRQDCRKIGNGELRKGLFAWNSTHHSTSSKRRASIGVQTWSAPARDDSCNGQRRRAKILRASRFAVFILCIYRIRCHDDNLLGR